MKASDKRKFNDVASTLSDLDTATREKLLEAFAGNFNAYNDLQDEIDDCLDSGNYEYANQIVDSFETLKTQVTFLPALELE